MNRQDLHGSVEKILTGEVSRQDVEEPIRQRALLHRRNDRIAAALFAVLVFAGLVLMSIGAVAVIEYIR